jgi:hypothetical protein
MSNVLHGSVDTGKASKISTVLKNTIGVAGVVFATAGNAQADNFIFAAESSPTGGAAARLATTAGNTALAGGANVVVAPHAQRANIGVTRTLTNATAVSIHTALVRQDAGVALNTNDTNKLTGDKAGITFDGKLPNGAVVSAYTGRTVINPQTLNAGKFEGRAFNEAGVGARFPVGNHAEFTASAGAQGGRFASQAGVDYSAGDYKASVSHRDSQYIRETNFAVSTPLDSTVSVGAYARIDHRDSKYNTVGVQVSVNLDGDNRQEYTRSDAHADFDASQIAQGELNNSQNQLTHLDRYGHVVYNAPKPAPAFVIPPVVPPTLICPSGTFPNGANPALGPNIACS